MNNSDQEPTGRGLRLKEDIVLDQKAKYSGSHSSLDVCTVVLYVHVVCDFLCVNCVELEIGAAAARLSPRRNVIFEASIMFGLLR